MHDLIATDDTDNLLALLSTFELLAFAIACLLRG